MICRPCRNKLIELSHFQELVMENQKKILKFEKKFSPRVVLHRFDGSFPHLYSAQEPYVKEEPVDEMDFKVIFAEPFVKVEPSDDCLDFSWEGSNTNANTMDEVQKEEDFEWPESKSEMFSTVGTLRVKKLQSVAFQNFRFFFLAAQV
jgi:hypothetical protein